MIKVSVWEYEFAQDIVVTSGEIMLLSEVVTFSSEGDVIDWSLSFFGIHQAFGFDNG